MHPPTIQPVSDVERAVEPLPETSPKQALEGMLKGPVEACSQYGGTMVPCRLHPFVSAVHRAFTQHRPLTLSPDMFWLLIAQGFARHVAEHVEQYRTLFAAREGRERIRIARHDFHKGSLENPWGEVLHEFSQQLKERIGPTHHRRLVVEFSTTGPVEKAASEVVLMNTVKSYYQYSTATFCGIPEVVLEGAQDDWRRLRDRTQELGAAYDVASWTDRLLPTLETIAANVAGSDERELWRSIYKWESVSGGDGISGWILDFFPYLNNVDGEVYPNPYQPESPPNPRTRYSQIGTSDLPGGLCGTPFLWHYFDRSYSMEFLAGFTGFTQQKGSLAVRPQIGWAVREAPDRAEPE